jgi:heme/copper-type cytochrome/quinol oxidase subunit 2
MIVSIKGHNNYLIIMVVIIIIVAATKGYSVYHIKYCSEQGDKNHDNNKNTNVEIQIQG